MVGFDRDQFRSTTESIAISFAHSSLTENTRRLEDREERKENREIVTFPTLPTRVSNTPIKTGHKIPQLRIGNNSFLLF